jgi:chromosome segregation ATPase
MARGITEEDVHQAADTIVTRGERPTIERIRAELGRGSPNTVNRHLDAWWATLPKRLATQADGVPSEVVELARKIWGQVMPRATELAKDQMSQAASAVEARSQQLERAEEELEQQRHQLAEARIALDRRIGELEAVLSVRDQALKDAKRANERTAAKLKDAQAALAANKASLAKAQSAHAAESSKLAERLAGTERRLMERRAQEKTARDVDGTAARKRIKSLEEDLRTARKLLDEQSAAALRLQANVGSELDGLRKLLTRPPRVQIARGAKSARTKSRKKSKDSVNSRSHGESSE